MRRLLALAIAVLIGLPAISPLFALESADDLKRPACCRRDGKHHCMLVDADTARVAFDTRSSAIGTRFKTVAVSERCPYGSKTLPSTTHPDWTLRSVALIFARVLALPSVAAQMDSQRSIEAACSQQKRGPPVGLLA